MSVINKMLQDLDRRQALGTGAEAGAVRAAASNPRHREWFWRTVTLLLTIGVGWVLWTAYHLLPRPLVTDLAYRAAEEARARPAPAAVRVEAMVPVAAAPKVAAVAAPLPQPAKQPPPAAEPLKMAKEIETPVRARAEKPRAQPAGPKAAPAPTPVAAAPERKPAVDKRERSPAPPAGPAEAHFRRAALLLSYGRVSEAEAELVAALKADPAHAASRQAYVALLLEQQRVAHARRLLEEALALDPAQPAFVLALARIYAGQRDYPKALEVLERAGPAAEAPEHQATRGTILQRLGRDGEAVRAFQRAIGGAPQPATTWVSLAISLEALGRKAEAAEAYRKALSVGPLAAEAREYAENRARALQ